MAEERLGQRRMVAAFVEGVEIEPVDRTPLAAVDFVAVTQLAHHARARDLRAFGTDVLALFVVERSEKVVERRPTRGAVQRVFPMELPIETRQPVAAIERLGIVLGDEVDMRG